MFTQAAIDLDNPTLVAELKISIENALVTYPSEFLQTVKRFGLRVRQLEQLFQQRVFEQLPGRHASRLCEELYRELRPSDQGLIREFYLTKIEELPVELRAKYSRLFRYQ
jgi:hypothetical protein